MSRRTLHHLRDNAVAYTAVFLVIALAPTSAYATHLVVRSSDIVNGQVKKPDLAAGAVSTPKIRNSAVTGPKIRNGAIGLGDLSATARPRHPEWRGSDNANAVAIPADRSTTVLTLALPAGHWFVVGKGVISTLDAAVFCDLVSGGQLWDETRAYHFNDLAHIPMSLGQRVVLSTAGTVEIRCIAGSGTQAVYDTKLNAIRVRG